ncbi:MAG: flagellar hook-basal body protein [SAR324 cluster bacterium]|nr:flagellar hook-basal body protein [SAR324 cluster bacterium]
MDSIFTLLSAMKGNQRQMDATANNLANANTPGFKRDQVLFREMYTEFSEQDLESEEESFAHENYLSPLSRGGTSFVMPDHVSPQMNTGRIIPTSSPKDIAIQNDGFLVVQGSKGTAYTRDGRFLEDQEGFLITKSGDRVMGEKGPILVGGKDMAIGSDGAVIVGGQLVDKLQVVKFEQPTRLTKLGGGYWAPGSDKQIAMPQKDPRIAQGVYESSNVDVVTEMVDMITVNRSFEAAQRAMRSNDSLDEKSITIARI